MNPFTQDDFPVRLLWGPNGARAAAERRDVLVIVDVLRFSSAVAFAVESRVDLYPAGPGEENELAGRYDAAIAKHSMDADAVGGFSLSPSSFDHAESGHRVVISPVNGAACARLASRVPQLLAAGLVNAAAVGRVVNEFVARSSVTILACGERWNDHGEDGDLRFALEDYLGAGAVLSRIEARMSPEAEVCRAAFEASRNNIRGLLWECASGRELREKGLSEDVDRCSALDVLGVAPVLREGCFREYWGLDRGGVSL